MKLSINWLADFVDLRGLTPEEIGLGLTRSTCEVEAVTEVYEHLEAVRVARIVEKKPHPNANRLSLCLVDNGKKRLPVVCGAANAREGLTVALADIGCRLPRPDAAILEIKPTVIRGEHSQGMLCSAGELQLTELFGEGAGILELDGEELAENIRAELRKATPGMPLTDLIPLRDTIVEIDNKSITHRPDLWSHFGFARELAVIFNRKIIRDPLRPGGISTGGGAGKKRTKSALPKSEEKEIVISPEAAKTYFGQLCTGARVVSSPLWMQARLLNTGQRPISNLVDASNYLTLEIGQPNHIFDAANLKSKTISVVATGKSAAESSFTTLDGVEQKIPPGTVMIVDGRGKKGEVVAIGGVMGGLKSGVNDNTTDLFLESATFHRETIRRTLSALPLRTESAIRFEKGLDPAQARPALARLVELIRMTCPDLSAGAITGTAVEGPLQNRIELTLDFLNRRLGFEVKGSEVKRILERLGFAVQILGTGKGLRFKIRVPTFRSQYDVSIPEDIVEEIGRIHGYDNMVGTTPLIPCEQPLFNEERLLERRLKNLLVTAGGFTESNNYSFATAADNRMFGMEGIVLKNPSLADRDRMRVSLIPGLLRHGVVNQDRFDDVRLFEFGRIYLPRDVKGKGDTPARELKRFSLLHLPRGADHSAADSDRDSLFLQFLKLRSLIDNALAEILAGESRTVALPSGLNEPDCPTSFLHPGCAVRWESLSGEILGVGGILHPAFESKFDLKRRALIAEIYFDRIFRTWSGLHRESRYLPPSIYPDSRFEFSIVMGGEESTARPLELIEGLAIPEVLESTLLTIYRGEPLPPDKKSVSYEVHCGVSEGTLPGERVQAILAQIVTALNGAGYPLR